MLYWEFDTKENYGLAQKKLYGSYLEANGSVLNSFA